MHNKQDGKLVVRGHDRVELTLKHFPKKIEVKFLPKCTSPCDQPIHGCDKLNWDVKRVCHGFYGHRYILTISWQVNGTREISWEANY